METCAAFSGGEKQWLRNLVERRMDVILIAQGDMAYTRNYFSTYITEDYQSYFAENFGFEGYFEEYSESLHGNWNTDAKQFLLESGFAQDMVDEYDVQEVSQP